MVTPIEDAAPATGTLPFNENLQTASQTEGLHVVEEVADHADLDPDSTCVHGGTGSVTHEVSNADRPSLGNSSMTDEPATVVVQPPIHIYG
ncbi:hypothetical protein V6N13_114918 [Hibiscus sabdariffa]